MACLELLETKTHDLLYLKDLTKITNQNQKTCIYYLKTKYLRPTIVTCHVKFWMYVSLSAYNSTTFLPREDTAAKKSSLFNNFPMNKIFSCKFYETNFIWNSSIWNHFTSLGYIFPFILTSAWKWGSIYLEISFQYFGFHATISSYFVFWSIFHMLSCFSKIFQDRPFTLLQKTWCII